MEQQDAAKKLRVCCHVVSCKAIAICIKIHWLCGKLTKHRSQQAGGVRA